MNKLFNDNFENLDALKKNQIYSEEIEWENSYNIADHYADQILLYPTITSLKEYIQLYQNITIIDMKRVVGSIIDFKNITEISRDRAAFDE